MGYRNCMVSFLERHRFFSTNHVSAYPLASVIGFDISNIQPEWGPSNLAWQLGDLHDGLNYDNHHFDLVHISHMDG